MVHFCNVQHFNLSPLGCEVLRSAGLYVYLSVCLFLANVNLRSGSLYAIAVSDIVPGEPFLLGVYTQEG